MKKRLDQILVDNGFVESKTKAQALIMAGQVSVGDKIVDKVGTKIDEDVEVSVKELFPYVSRGALKLEKAYQEFGLDFTDKTVCDIGSSTGGFTDFALQHGAKKVYAIDVGTGQLAQKVREDSRVVVMEKTDFRDIQICHSREGGNLKIPDRVGDDNKSIYDPIDIFVCDVSFISLKKIIPKVWQLAHDQRPTTCDFVALIKPQFEAGAKEVSKGKGVIKDEALRQQIVTEISEFATSEGFNVIGVAESPITGAKGNVEYLLYLRTK